MDEFTESSKIKNNRKIVKISKNTEKEVFKAWQLKSLVKDSESIWKTSGLLLKRVKTEKRIEHKHR